ncbi:MAG: HAMP domain-containing sensor histidine kinase [Bacteroidetes bacterium]|nr:HAMP domain-containing sensor histidine kinase [Bacteroidota bacterium]
MSSSDTSRKPRAENRPSIGFARHRRFASEEQPTIATFAHVLGHRIRGLITSIEGFTDLLIPTLDDPDQREYAFRILESTSRIEGILKDLQHFNDPIEAHFHKVPGNAISSDLKAILADSEISRLSVEEHVSERVFVRADETLIRQALMAVLRNAYDACASSDEVVHMIVDRSNDGENVVIKIQNPGLFSDMDARLRIFEPFFTTKASNLGLGLTLARRIARVHGGELSLTSDDNSEYTELTLTLPVLSDV